MKSRGLKKIFVYAFDFEVTTSSRRMACCMFVPMTSYAAGLI
jgi:hypothetical protein